MHRYKVGYGHPEGSFFREFDHPDALSVDELRAHVVEAVAVVAEADRARWDAMVVEEKAKGTDIAFYDEPWHEHCSVGGVLSTNDFRDAMLVRGFRESEYVASVALHGWANTFDRPGPGGSRWGEKSADMLAFQAAMRKRMGVE